MPLPQAWSRRQEVQQAPVESTLIKRSGKNKYSGGQEPPAKTRRKEGGIRRNLYALDVNRGRNCYICREFGHITQNCRN